MSSFFTAPASQKKRKRADGGAGKPAKRRDTQRNGERNVRSEAKSRPPQRKLRADEERDEEVSGSESEDDVEPESAEESDASSEEDETPAERRARLAQRYLDRLKGEVDEAGFDAADLDKDIIARRLKEDVDEAKGRQFRLIADTLDFEHADHTAFRADTLSTNAVAVHKPYAYTVSKDKTLIKWQIHTPEFSRNGPNGTIKNIVRKKRPKQLAYVKRVKIDASSSQQHGHNAEILSVAVSPDGRYVATGGADKKLIIWSTKDLRPLKTFTTHRDSVTSLDFSPEQLNDSGFGAQLFSASMDRSIKTYSLAGDDSLAYVETLFGHQDHVVALSAMAMDQCVSVGARDRSARLWRVVEETQLKFLGDSSRSEQYQTGSLDCIAALPPHHFVTGSDSGALALWSVHKKKSLFTIQTAHGTDSVPPLAEVTSEADPAVIAELEKYDKRIPRPRAITALVALPGTDVVLSGSWDGNVRIWKLSDDKRSLLSLGTLGQPSLPQQDGPVSSSGELAVMEPSQDQGIVRGVINGLAVFERRREIVNEFGGKKEGECQGLCVVVATGKDERFGRWHKITNGRNGAMVFEVPLKV